MVRVHFHGVHIVHPVYIIVDTCRKTYIQVVQYLQESHEYYLDLTEVPTQAQVAKWEEEIRIAETKRSVNPEAMDIMEPKVPKRKSTSIT